VAADSQRVARDPARGVRIDLWDFERDVAAAGNALQAGDIDAHVAALERACGRWIGEPLADVDAIDGVTAEVEAVRRQLAATALRLASLQLDRRRYDEAARWAARVRAAAPYDERAHRVLIAAHLGRGDQTAACEAAEATLATLAELDVDPEADTSALVEAALARPLSLMLATRTARARR
jgi:DNA-binding SARP family transcriptional activator